ncbi:hypothetical protein LUZ60_001555 [Juncus effusus]|nr:hypothetical protein LUZ60_001555 [Juncus effusus]
MKVLLYLVLFFAIFCGLSEATWCVCRQDLNDTLLQKTIDYACGAGADCNPIKEKGACYNPNTVKAHCSYAANSYYQRMNEQSATCDFSGTATISSSDPSSNGCTYPATPSAAGTSSSTNGTFSPQTGSTYGLGPSAYPDNTNSGFRPETPFVLQLLCTFFMIIKSFHVM